MENLANYLDTNNWIAGDRELQLLGFTKTVGLKSTRPTSRRSLDPHVIEYFNLFLGDNNLEFLAHQTNIMYSSAHQKPHSMMKQFIRTLS